MSKLRTNYRLSRKVLQIAVFKFLKNQLLYKMSLCSTFSIGLRVESAILLEQFLSNLQRERMEIALAIVTDSTQELR